VSTSAAAICLWSESILQILEVRYRHRAHLRNDPQQRRHRPSRGVSDPARVHQRTSGWNTWSQPRFHVRTDYGGHSEPTLNPRGFPADPPRYWAVFISDGGNRARLWSVVENHGVISSDGDRRVFALTASDVMADLNNRLVIGWRSPRAWQVKATTAANYTVLEIADAAPIPFPGFDELVLDYTQLQAVM
jgi:hypothetical protein